MLWAGGFGRSRSLLRCPGVRGKVAGILRCRHAGGCAAPLSHLPHVREIRASLWGNGALAGAGSLCLAQCLWFSAPQGISKEEGRGDERMLHVWGRGATSPSMGKPTSPPRPASSSWNSTRERGGSPEPSRYWGACVLGGLQDEGTAGRCGDGSGAQGPCPGSGAGARGPCRGSGALPGLAPLPAQPQPFPAAMAGPRRLQATARPQGGRHGRAGPLCPSCRPAASMPPAIATFPFPPPHPHRQADFVLLRRLAARSKGRQGRNGGGAGDGSPQPPKGSKTPQKVPAGGCQDGGQGWLGPVTSLGVW